MLRSHTLLQLFVLVVSLILHVFGDKFAGGPQDAPSSLSAVTTETLDDGSTQTVYSTPADTTVPTTTSVTSASWLSVPSCLNFCLNAAGATLGASSSLCQNTDFGGNVEQCADAKCSDNSWTNDFSKWETTFCQLSAAATSTSTTAAASSSSATAVSSTVQSTITSSAVASTSSSSTGSSSSSYTSTSTPQATSTAPSSSTTLAPMLSNSTASPTTSPIPSGGLNTPAKAGIGVGAAGGGFLMLAFLIFWIWRHAKRSRQQHQEEGAAKESQSQIWRDSELVGHVPPTYEEKGKGKEEPGPVELPASDWRHSGRSELDTYGPKSLTPSELDDLMRHARMNGTRDDRGSGVAILRRYQQPSIKEPQPPGELDAMVRRVRTSGVGEAHQDRGDGDRYYAAQPGMPRHL